MNMISPTTKVETLCQQAAQFLDTGRPGAARPLMAAARALDPASATVALLEARLALANGASGDAASLLDTALTAHPQDVRLRKCRADLRYRVGDWEGAARDAAEAITIDPSDPTPKASLGAALLKLGHPADAIACLDEALAAAPHLEDCRKTLARALEIIGQPETALAVLRDGINRSLAGPSVYNAAMLLLFRHRDFSAAAALATQAGATGCANGMTFALKGHALCKQGRHEEAARAYQEAARLTPEDRYLRQMAAIYNLSAPIKRTPPEFLRQAFDACASGFDAHEAALGYAIPELIASVVASHPALSAANELGPALDLGCGTGLVVAALADLPTGPFTGIDLSPAMLAEARRKERYADLQEADIMSFLKRDVSQWPLVIAADVVPYFGELTELMIGISQRLSRDGWFVFSTEQLLADRDGVLPGNGEWALQHEGRFAHSQSYLYDCLYEAGLRIVRKDECFIRHEAGTQVPGLLVVAAPVAA